jgi:hypothetical protein
MTSRLPFRAEFGVLPVTISSSIEFVRRIGKEEKCLFALAFEGSNSREKSERGRLIYNSGKRARGCNKRSEEEEEALL